MGRFLGSPVSYLALVVIVATALVIGSTRPTVSTSAQRIAGLEAIIKCPSCDDLSIAQSDASTAVTLRRAIVAWVNEGRSNAFIENAIVARYGQDELLTPASSGLDVLVWAIPLGVIAVGGSAVLATIARRRRSRSDAHGVASAADEALVAAARLQGEPAP